MKKTYLSLLFAVLFLASCEDEDNGPSINNPETYSFEREGQSTVSFDGQTTRIKMAGELSSNMTGLTATADHLLELFRNETADGGDANPYTDATLNAATKNIKGKVAASADYFAANTTESSSIKAQFEEWVTNQANEVFANQDQLASPGVAGQIASGTRTRYVNTQGFEYNQLVNKGLLGALMTDQALNNYLSTAVLDANTDRTDNDKEVVVEGTNYTSMEHHWDEAYGYLYGLSADPTNPNLTIGEDDDFLNEYIGRVDSDSDFSGIADDIFNAFKLGRAAIVAGDYTTRDQQIAIIKEAVSKVIAVRCVHYLQGGKNELPANREDYSLYGPALHELSEGFGFLYSLRFTRQPDVNAPYFSKSEVDEMMNDILSGTNGLWDVDATALDQISEKIASKFGFSVDQAAN